ncbi:MAG: helix-turn-helix domain-containing protein [Eubacterium sp.]|nr:helix-turn-helix domain-containing protein [Eubacterium sp.]
MISNTNQKTEQTEFQVGFLMNLRIIADSLIRSGLEIFYYPGKERSQLAAARLYKPGRILKRDTVYFITAEEMVKREGAGKLFTFVVFGDYMPPVQNYGMPMIVIHQRCDMMDTLELAQDTFLQYSEWDFKLQRALNGPHPLDDMLKASIPIFRNPMFIHDQHFFILSDPEHQPEMTKWDKDKRTGRTMVNLETINDFRTDHEYLEGLKTHTPQMFSANQTGYRILYRNLWNNNQYLGRILVDEVKNPLYPGDFHAMEYMGRLLEFYTRERRLVRLDNEDRTEEFFAQMIQRESVEEREIARNLNLLNWKLHDRYICLRMRTEHEDFNQISADAMLSQIENNAPQSRAFFYEDGITVIVNLSYTHTTAADVVQGLAILIRDSLLKIGVSTEVQDFRDLASAYRQAKNALEFGLAGQSMLWYFYFDDYMLDYMIDCTSKEIPARLLCAEALRKLKKFDEENHSELYHTLEVYLNLQENVLRTSKELFIHRSTLTYRLTRIQKIINMDLDDSKTKLKLLISYYMMRSVEDLEKGEESKEMDKNK